MKVEKARLVIHGNLKEYHSSPESSSHYCDPEILATTSLEA